MKEYLNIFAFIIGVTVGVIIIACIIYFCCWLVKDFIRERQFYRDLRKLYIFEGEQGKGRNVTAEFIEKMKESKENE